tara:strand:+ start:7431 stop:8057 length:627 start_codon:yes stop_codon:yes gene_type:complete
MGDIINTLLTGGVAVALVGVAGQVLVWWLDKLKRGNHKSDSNILPEQVENLIEIQQIMERVLDKSPVKRFLIFKTENGGGKPRLGSHLYASAIYEAYRTPMVAVIDDYQRLLVDDIYVKMLSDIGPSSPNKLIRNDMKDGLLKRIYLKENVTYAEVHYLAETNNAFYYLSIATDEETERFNSPLNRVEIEIAVNKIANIFNGIINLKE